MNPGRWLRHSARQGLSWLAASVQNPERWAAVLLVLSIGLGLATFGPPTLEEIEGEEETARVQHTVEQLQSRVKVQPMDAFAWLDLGHSQFAKGEREAALSAYAEALALDRTLASEKMIENLIACYGEPCQEDADALIRTYELKQAGPRLKKVVRHGRYRPRYAAIRTLDRMNEATRDDYLALWMQDLDSPNCDVRRNAVERLGRLGDRRALERIRAAKKKDDEQTPWYRFTCLGRLAIDAEEQILARN